MTKLFEATRINGMTLSNRFIRSATWEGMATGDGEATPQLTAVMEKLVLAYRTRKFPPAPRTPNFIP